LQAQNTHTFNILHGSGHFSVKVNDTSIADVRHINRQVTLIPKKAGTVRIEVEDVELPDSVVTEAELVVSDILILHLDSQGYLIEQDDSLNMTVTAFDTHGTEFDKD